MSFSDFTTDDELLAKRLKEVAESVKNKPNEMDAKLEGRYISCSGEEKSMTMEFPVLEWETNYGGILHGGIICTMLDHAAGVTAICFMGGWTPTVDLDVHFLRPAKAGDTLIGKACIEFCGSRIIHLRAELVSKTTGKKIASALATYINH